MTKIIINTPVFHKENEKAPVLQLLNYSKETQMFETHDVIKGCSSTPVHVENITSQNISVYIEEFMGSYQDMGDVFYTGVLGKVNAGIYLHRLGIDAFTPMVKSHKKNYDQQIHIKEA